MTFTDSDYFVKSDKELAALMAPAGAKPWKVRQKVVEAGDLRFAWAQALSERCGLRIIGLLDGRWIRKLNAEHVALYLSKLGERGVVVPAGTPSLIEVENACVPELGAQVSEEMSTKYRSVYETRRVKRYLTDVLTAEAERLGHGVVDAKTIDRERISLLREWVYFWSWVRDEKRVGCKASAQGLLPMGAGATGLKELFKESLSSGDGKVVVPSGVSPWVAKATEAMSVEPTRTTMLGVMGLWLTEGGRVEGKLALRWEYLLADAMLTGGVFGPDRPSRASARGVAREVGKAYLGAVGLVEDNGLVADGVGTKSTLVERAKVVAVERLMLDHVARTGYSVSGYEPQGLVAVGRVPRGGTVLRSMLDRLPSDARSYWLAEEDKGGSTLVTNTLTDVKLMSLFDGLSSAYLFQFFPSADGKTLPGSFENFWKHEDDEPVGVDTLWVIRDALMASHMWALSQMVGHGHEWLGLSDGYRRAFLLAFRRLFRWVFQPYPIGDAEPMKEGHKDVILPKFVSEDKIRFFRSLVLQGLTRPDRLLQAERMVGGLTIPKNELVSFVVPKSDCMTSGSFVDEGNEFVWSNEGGGVLLPGLTGEVEGRVLGNLVNLLASGTSRHARAILVAEAVRANGGKLPPVLLPMVPTGMGDVMAYADVVDSTGGAGLRDLLTPKAAVSPASADLKPEVAALWTWGKLKSHWGIAGMYPGLALPYWVGPTRCVSKMLSALPRGMHPFSGIPLSEGGGAVEAEMVKRVWAPFFVDGIIGPDRLASSVRTALSSPKAKSLQPASDKSSS